MLLTCLYCDGFNFGCPEYIPEKNEVCRRYRIIDENIDAVVDLLDGRTTESDLVEIMVTRELQKH